jgi:transketolase
MSLDDIRDFRQLPGEHPAIETTTGPLGQGLATAVGMAIAERNMAARFGKSLVDHRTWVVASDDDMMEGISHEASGLAGHIGLSKLNVLYTDNSVSIMVKLQRPVGRRGETFRRLWLGDQESRWSRSNMIHAALSFAARSGSRR